MSAPKYPNVKVRLSRVNGNAFALMAAVKTAMKKAKIPDEEGTLFVEEATSGDYDHLIQTCMKWVAVS